MIRVRRFEEKDAQALAGLMTEITRFSGATVRPDLVVAEDVVQQARRVDVIVVQKMPVCSLLHLNMLRSRSKREATCRN